MEKKICEQRPDGNEKEIGPVVPGTEYSRGETESAKARSKEAYPAWARNSKVLGQNRGQEEWESEEVQAVKGRRRCGQVTPRGLKTQGGDGPALSLKR